MSEEINFDDVEFGEPIEEREPNYRDGYIRGIYRARNIIDNQQKEIERLNNIINEINSIVEYWGYDKEHNDISSFRMAMKNIKDILGSDKE